MEYRRVEKFQMSPCCKASTLPHNGARESIDHGTVLGKSSSHLEPLQTAQDKSSCEKSDNASVALNLSVCPDGSQINISSNGTTLTATKTSLNATIGSFTITVNCHDPCTLIKEDICGPPVPAEPSLVAVTTAQGYPIHVALQDSPSVKADISLTEIFTNEHTHLVTLYSNGQGAHYLLAKNNTYYIAIDSCYNIQALPAAETENVNADVYTIRREDLPDDQARYYLETDGNKYYLTATSDGDITTTQLANDAASKQSNQSQYIFYHLYG